MALEIAVQDPTGAQVAQAAGADRVELCSALALGGLTPSIATIEACAALPIPTLVLVRSRGGGYFYSPDEVALQAADITACLRAGAAGVVVGALTAVDTLDLDTLQRWREAAYAANPQAEFVVHRCVDVVLGPAAGAKLPETIARLSEDLRALHVTRVLTSGGAPCVAAGLETLGALTTAVASHLEVMAGGGLKVADFPALAALGVPSAHLSCRRSQTQAGPVGPGGGPAEYDVTSPTHVATTVKAARAAGIC